MQNLRILSFTRFICIGFLMLSHFVVHAQNSHNSATSLQHVGTIDSLYSQLLGETREIYIQLPASYHQELNRTYAVAYILDGELLLPTVYEVQKYYSGGFTPEMVLVGISNNVNRTRDLTTSEITMNFGRPYTQENGKAANFISFIESELIPFIEKSYRVTNYRTLIGHSYGGLFTLYTFVHHPYLFANYLAIDPSLDWDNQKMLADAKQHLPKNDYSNKALFMSLSGQLHWQDPSITIDNVMLDTSDFTLFSRANIQFNNYLKSLPNTEAISTWKFYPNDIHGTVPFPSIMDGLINMFAWYQMENTAKINDFDTSIDELLAIIKHRENKLNAHFNYAEPPYPEELLIMSGYMNMDMQQFDKAKMYFEQAIKYYPESANNYDSIADYYASQNDLTNAIKSLNKAYELSEDSRYKERIESLKKIKN